MSLSDNSIKNPVFAWMLFIGIVVFGLIAYSRLGVSQLPDVLPLLNDAFALPTHASRGRRHQSAQ